MLATAKKREIERTLELLETDFRDLKKTTDPQRALGRIRGDLANLAEQMKSAGLPRSAYVAALFTFTRT